MSIQNNSLHAFHLLAEIFRNLQYKELKIKLMWPKTNNCLPKDEPHHGPISPCCMKVYIIQVYIQKCTSII